MALSYEIGIAAGILFVIGYALLNFGVLSSTSPLYQTLNLLGALGFTYTAIAPFNPGLFVTEAVWAVVAAYGLWKIWAGPRHDAPETAPGVAPA
ncbi:CBU_0592 family membrane protein [Mobilicoccus pelagius]|uniref:Putative transporter n=1 Tax=Mobilicoccus pelagius NBRC 104925 TaxID=1089455 RepID=H5UPS1_9MICO|nr:hypothetical protein [Mobilicoccus pelagius]GAB47726.1 putative transporter [Mobilicoccus pelagius NBRC 104925]